MNRKTKIIVLSYSAGALFLVAGVIFSAAGGARGYRTSQDIEYRRALAQLVSSVSTMDEVLEKGKYAEGTGMTGKLCAELMSGARSASTALSILPLETYAIEELGEFLSRVEEYARVKGDLACIGKGFTDEDRELSAQLQAVTGELVPVLGELYTHVTEGGLSIRGWLHRDGIIEESATGYLEDELLKLLSDFPQMPALVYAGKLSDDYDHSYKGLTGLETVTEEEALVQARNVAGVEGDLTPMGESQGELPCYYFGGETDNGSLTLAVTKQGGLPLLYLREYTAGEETVDAEAAQTAAENFLYRAGYDGLSLYDTEDRDGLLALRYVFTDGSAAHPDDGVEVTVALDRGVVVAMDASDYVENHGRQGQTDVPALTAEQVAARAVPEGLEVLREELTWFTRDTGLGVLCRRFECRDAQGASCVIYADANTGAQVEIHTADENVSEM